MRPTAILALARLYVSGSLRRQAHLATLFMGVVLFMLPAYVNAFSLGSGAVERVCNDFGLTLITYFIVAMALLLGSTSVPADLETRSLYPVLARPISRGGFLVAHFLAVVSMLGGSVLFLGFCLLGSVGLMLRYVNTSLLVALYGSFLQAAVIAGVCLLASIRLSPVAAGVAGGVLFLVGNLTQDFFSLWLPGAAQGGFSMLAAALKAVIPDLSVFALKEPVVHNVTMPAFYLLSTTVYGLGWMLVLLMLAQAAFEEVDL